MKNYRPKEKVKALFTYAAYLIYFVAVVYIAIYAENSPAKIGLVVISIIALPIAIYSEYLKSLYQKALYVLNFELNVKKSMDIYNDLMKKDIFKGYRQTKNLYYVQAYAELEDGNKMLEILLNNEKEFRAGTNMLMVFYYYQIRAYLLNNDYENAQEAYQATKGLRQLKKPVKIFSWDEIDGLAGIAYHNIPKAYKAFSKVNMKNMNPKERLFIIKNLIKCSKNDNDRIKHQRVYDSLVNEVNKNIG